MSDWFTILVVGAAVLALSYLALALLARRLPPGLLRDLVEFIPACVTTARVLRRHPDAPRRAKVALLVAIVWTISPIDLIPEFLPVIGPLDDIVVIALAIRYAARAVPREVLLAAWPAQPRLLERLIGNRDPGARLEPHA
ncbi:MAG TPA: DUF1232 domain-containing protein [Nocardioidaceae bacterium]|nr:DUF1232 domain-containing protein [Nocardioidaceae bacterium]